MQPIDPAIIKPHLDYLFEKFDITFLSPDPLFAALPYSKNSDDAEVALFIAGCFAYGQAHLIERNLTLIFKQITPSPARFAERAIKKNGISKNWMRGFKYRFNDRADLVSLIKSIGLLRKEYGSLLNLLQILDEDQSENLIIPFSKLTKKLIELSDNRSSSFRHLLPNIDNKSPLKRYNLFLRWMVRKDKVDPGLWSTHFSKSRLLIPLDTHVGRITRRLSILDIKNDSMKAAISVTNYLKLIDPEDPVKYDFAICSYGKLGYCLKSSRLSLCHECRMENFCVKN